MGIDLGTTNSAVAAMEGGKPTIVTNAEGQRTTPSVIAYTKTGDQLVGQIAKRQGVVNPDNTFFSVKRFIGRKMAEVNEELKQVPYIVEKDSNGNVKLSCPALGKEFAALLGTAQTDPNVSRAAIAGDRATSSAHSRAKRNTTDCLSDAWRPGQFAFLGVDFIMDADGRPYLIEFSKGPGIRETPPFLRDQNLALIPSMLDMVLAARAHWLKAGPVAFARADRGASPEADLAAALEPHRGGWVPMAVDAGG